MAGNVTTFAIRYESKSGAHLYRPGGKVSYSRDEAAAALGRILWAAHCRGEKLDWVRVVPCVKRPGTKPVFEMSRRTMSQEQLVHFCKVFTLKAYPSR